MIRIKIGQEYPVYQYTKDDELVRLWPSGKEAGETLGINRSDICECLNGRYKYAGKFIWKYVYEQINPNEIFRKHPSLDIECSNLGRVRYKKELVSKGQKNGCGYMQIDLILHGKRKRHLVHRLIAETFYPEEKNACDLRTGWLSEVDHIDGDKANNNVLNLEWVSSRENTQRYLAMRKLNKKC